ncbi:hypothetical protein FHY25_001509 [Xanthomonas arboricola]|uniref:hypothetical protein n=1 Tax=Xanthomonas campestris TaxID=339 RepID=UPI0023E94E7B|nr:hypothetical protein [Xanthomonas campestris]MCW2006928.1 hypothetical protein [Xanthomonas campestris]
MRSDNTQGDLQRGRQPTAADWRASAEAALRNPYETPARCQRRHDYCLQQAQRCEEGERG